MPPLDFESPKANKYRRAARAVYPIVISITSQSCLRRPSVPHRTFLSHSSDPVIHRQHAPEIALHCAQHAPCFAPGSPLCLVAALHTARPAACLIQRRFRAADRLPAVHRRRLPDSFRGEAGPHAPHPGRDPPRGPRAPAEYESRVYSRAAAARGPLRLCALHAVTMTMEMHLLPTVRHRSQPA
jgi:hypothetical protein